MLQKSDHQVTSHSAWESHGPRDHRGMVSNYFGGLLWTLVRTDFKSRYHGSFGGYMWALLKPLAMFLVLLSVFSFVFHNDPNYKLNLIIGLFLYDFFSE